MWIDAELIRFCASFNRNKIQLLLFENANVIDCKSMEITLQCHEERFLNFKAPQYRRKRWWESRVFVRLQIEILNYLQIMNFEIFLNLLLSFLPSFFVYFWFDDVLALFDLPMTLSLLFFRKLFLFFKSLRMFACFKENKRMTSHSRCTSCLMLCFTFFHSFHSSFCD